MKATVQQKKLLNNNLFKSYQYYQQTELINSLEIKKHEKNIYYTSTIYRM